MKRENNRNLLAEAKTSLNRFLNADGDNGFDHDDADYDGADGDYDDADGEDFDNAAGMSVAPRREKSRPYIVIVQNASGASQTVNLLNSASNRTAANFGNVAGITITYGYPNQTYGGFLSTTENMPFNLGKLRCEAQALANIPTSFVFTETQYMGDAQTTSLVPNIALNQFYQLAVEVPCDVLVNSTKLLQFVQLDATILTFKLYPAEVASLGRGLEKKKAVKVLDDPNTTVLPTQTIVIPQKSRGMGKRNYRIS